MGECGCSELEIINGVYRVGHLVLVSETYTGCRYCKTGLATSIHVFEPEDAATFDLIPTETLSPKDLSTFMRSFPLMNVSDLIDAAKDLPGIEHYAKLEDWLEDNGREMLSTAIYNRLRKTRKRDGQRRD